MEVFFVFVLSVVTIAVLLAPFWQFGDDSLHAIEKSIDDVLEAKEREQIILADLELDLATEKITEEEFERMRRGLN